jgi:hypothetical protein
MCVVYSHRDEIFLFTAVIFYHLWSYQACWVAGTAAFTTSFNRIFMYVYVVLLLSRWIFKGNLLNLR